MLFVCLIFVFCLFVCFFFSLLHTIEKKRYTRIIHIAFICITYKDEINIVQREQLSNTFTLYAKYPILL